LTSSFEVAPAGCRTLAIERDLADRCRLSRDRQENETVPRSVPTVVVHFTHVGHLPTILQRGLLSDSAAQQACLVETEVANQDIKAMRRRRSVPVPPGGVVADYAPFYFAPRSPMMYVIHRGGVATYAAGCDSLIYLVTDVERLSQLNAPIVFTDRNAVLGIAEFTADIDRLDTLIDWPLMRATMWNNTDAHPDRKERRMAECLVHGQVPWQAFAEIVAKTTLCAQQARTMVTAAGENVPVVVRPSWYF
jgi:hypothetical protein